MVVFLTVVSLGLSIKVAQMVLRVKAVPHRDLSWAILNSIVSSPAPIITTLLPLILSRFEPLSTSCQLFRPEHRLLHTVLVLMTRLIASHGPAVNYDTTHYY